MLLTGLACIFLQEYQHVHLLWFKKRSFTLVWKPNPPLLSVRCVHLLFSSRDQCDSCYNVPRLCCARCMNLWSSADYALAQVRPHQIFTCTFSKNGRSALLCFIHLVEKCKCLLFRGCLFLLMNHLIGWNTSIMPAPFFFTGTVLLDHIISTEVTESSSWTYTQQAELSFTCHLPESTIGYFCI